MLKAFALDLPGAMTQRGFWLYVWQVPVANTTVHYVGRTGDNSSPYASSVYRRFGQHLGDAENTNALVQHLRLRYPDRDIWDYESFRMIAVGPVFPEVDRHPDFRHGEAPHYKDAFVLHVPFRDRAAALESKLAKELRACGYDVLNEVASKAVLQPHDWQLVQAALLEHFPKMRSEHP
jgi:hypothetical protein